MRLYDRLRRRARQSPAKSTSTVASPISMKETTVVAQHPSGKGFGSDACLLLIALLGSFLLRRQLLPMLRGSLLTGLERQQQPAVPYAEQREGIGRESRNLDES